MTLLHIAGFPQGSVALPTSPVSQPQCLLLSILCMVWWVLLIFFQMLHLVMLVSVCACYLGDQSSEAMYALLLWVHWIVSRNFSSLHHQDRICCECPLHGNFPLLCHVWALVGAGHTTATQSLSKAVLFSSFFSDYKHFPHSGCYTELSTPVLCYTCSQLSEEFNTSYASVSPIITHLTLPLLLACEYRGEKKEPHAFSCSVDSSPICEVSSIFSLSSLPLFSQ